MELHYKLLNSAEDGALGAVRPGDSTDVYACVRDDGKDTAEADSNDMVLIGTSIAQDQLRFTQSDSDLIVSVIGLDQTVMVESWFNSPDNRAARVTTNDGNWVTDAGVDQLVQGTAPFRLPASGQTTLPPS